ncbi:MAG: hypothetical protein AB7F75_12865 [Planctomycetota bacterium]
MNQTHPLNEPLVSRHRARGYKGAPVVDPEAHPDPYMAAGSHPDVVARVWEELGKSFPEEWRMMIYGSPGLLHSSGVVMALAWGTAYAVRVPEKRLPEALARGCTTTRTWSDGSVTDLGIQMGPDWVFGNWVREEAQWLEETSKGL